MATPLHEPYQLLALAVFVDSHRTECVRSFHVHEQNVGCVYTIQQEFVLSKLFGGAYVQTSRLVMSAARFRVLLSSGNVKLIMGATRKMQGEDGWHCVLEYISDHPSEAFMPPLLMPSRNRDLKKIPSLERDLILVEKAMASVCGQSIRIWSAENGQVNMVNIGCGEDKTETCVDPWCGWHFPTLTLSCPSASLLASHSEQSTDIMPGLETPDRSSHGQPLFDIWQNWGLDLELASPKVSLDRSVCPRQPTLYTTRHFSSPNGADSSASFWSPSTSMVDLNLDLSESPPDMGGGKADCVLQYHEKEASSLLNLELGMPSKPLVSQETISPISCNQDSVGYVHGISATVVGDGHESVISFSSSEAASSITNNSTCSTAVNAPHNDTSTDWSSTKTCGHNMPSNYKSSSGARSTSCLRDQPACDAKQRCVKEGGSTTSERIMEISYQEVSVYFGMPISQAAKKLKVGLTVLKKRCRALGIPRWPHRKMKSIDSLIHNVKDFASEQGTKSSPRVQNVVKELEAQKRIMEEMPGVELAERTKKLRQACFKANYKKRRLGLMGGMSSVCGAFCEIGQSPSVSTPLYDPSSFNLLDLNPAPLDLNPALVVLPPSSDHCMMDHFL